MNGYHAPASQKFVGLVPLTQPLKRLLIAGLAWLLMEAFLGHPALRMQWQSRTGDAQHMVVCETLSITGERQTFYSQFKPLVCFTEPSKERTLRYWVLRPITRWFS